MNLTWEESPEKCQIHCCCDSKCFVRPVANVINGSHIYEWWATYLTRSLHVCTDFTFIPSLLKWTCDVFIGRWVGTFLIFLSSSFSFHAWHGWSRKLAVGGKRWPPPHPLGLFEILPSLVSVYVRPLTSSATTPDYWVESMEAVCLYSLCLQLVTLLIEKEGNWGEILQQTKCNISTLKCLIRTITLLFVFLSCVLTWFQTFPTTLKLFKR